MPRLTKLRVMIESPRSSPFTYGWFGSVCTVGARDEREVRRVDAVRSLVLLLQLLARGDDPRHVDLDRARDVRGGVERAAHVLGDAAAHRGHRLELLAGLRSAAAAGAARAASAARAARGGGAARPARRRGCGCRRRCGSCRAAPVRAAAGCRRGWAAALLDEARGCPSSSRGRRGPCRRPAPGRRRARTRCARRPARRSGCRSRSRPLRRASGAAAGALRLRSAAASRPARRRRPACAAACVAGSGGASGCAGALPAAGAPAAPPIWASFVPTSTVSPSWTRICVTRPARRARHLGVDLVGRDLEQRLVGLDVLALLLEPARDRPFRDGHAHLRHHDVDCGLRGHAAPSLILRELAKPLHDVFDLRDERLLERRRERHRRVGRGDALAPARRDPRTPPRRSSRRSRAPKPPVCVSSCSTSTFDVLRTDSSTAALSHGMHRAQVDDLDRDAVARRAAARPPRRCRPSRPT